MRLLLIPCTQLDTRLLYWNELVHNLLPIESGRRAGMVGEPIFNCSENANTSKGTNTKSKRDSGEARELVDLFRTFLLYIRIHSFLRNALCDSCCFSFAITCTLGVLQLQNRYRFVTTGRKCTEHIRPNPFQHHDSPETM